MTTVIAENVALGAGVLLAIFTMERLHHRAMARTYIGMVIAITVAMALQAPDPWSARSLVTLWCGAVVLGGAVPALLLRPLGEQEAYRSTPSCTGLRGLVLAAFLAGGAFLFSISLHDRLGVPMTTMEIFAASTLLILGMGMGIVRRDFLAQAFGCFFVALAAFLVGTIAFPPVSILPQLLLLVGALGAAALLGDLAHQLKRLYALETWEIIESDDHL